MSMLSAQDAIDLLRANPSAYTTPAALRSLVVQLNTDASGGKTVLYSGRVNGTSAGNVISGLLDQGADIRVIDETEAFKFLNSDDFLSATAESFGTTLDELTNPEANSPAKTAANNWLYDAKNGPWADISKSFAEATVGEVRFIGPDADSNRIFAQTELPALLSNTSVTSIEGIPTSDLQAIAAQGDEAIYQRIRTASLTSISYSGLKITNLGSGNIISGADDFLNKVTNLQSYLLEHPEAHGRFDAYIKELQTSNPTRYAEFKTVTQTMWADAAQSVSGGSKVLNKLGFLGTALSFALAANEASAAEASGNSEKAKEIMTLWAADAAGSALGEAAGATLGGIALAVAAVAGVAVSAPLAGAVLIGATLIGGIFGADAAAGVYQMTKDLDGNGRMDLLDKLGNLVFGVNYTITSPLPADLNGERLTLDTTFSRAEIVANAKTDIAWRYALRELNPFVIPDIDYSRHNTDGSLDLYDPTTGAGSMTALYLADRAAMLTWKIRFDRGERDDDDEPHDGVKPYNEDWDTGTVAGNWDFVDLKIRLPGGAPLTLAIDGEGVSLSDHQIVFGTHSGETLEGGGSEDHLYGMAGNDTLHGEDGADYLEGGGGTDVLIGGAGADHLIGGSGSDTLRGGSGNDTLEGGAGNDRYEVVAQGGLDVIRDRDGEIWFENVRLTGGKLKINGTTKTYLSEDEKTSFYFVGDPAGGGSLYISGSFGGVRVENYRYGDLGIQLLDEDSEPIVLLPPTTGGDILGDLSPIDQNPNQAGVQLGYDSLGNVLTNPASPEPGRSDNLYDGPNNDLIRSEAGNDFILLERGGNDRVKAGIGDDYVAVAASHGINSTTFIEGDSGADTLLGGTGSDTIMGASADSIDDVIAYGESEPSVAGKGDWISGNAGNDLLVGSATSDLVLGGAGDDTISGGGGDDNIFADAWGEPYSNWTFTRNPIEGTNGTTYNASVNARYWSAGVDFFGANLIFGGEGNDWIFGGSGSDTLSGGVGQDVIFGSDGFDLIYGGGDNDALHGEAGSDFLSGDDGNDTLQGGSGNLAGSTETGADTLDGGAGNDNLAGYGGDDLLFGGDQNDTIYGDHANTYLVPSTLHGNDTLYGGSGVDKLIGGGRDDYLDGGDSSDILYGDGDPSESAINPEHHGADTLIGGRGNDTIWGGGRSDILFGNSGNDSISGDEGNDILDGGTGADRLRGGEGDDAYSFGKDSGLDSILDTGGNDKILFSNEISSDGVFLYRSGGDLLIAVASAPSLQITVEQFFSNTLRRIESIEFGTGEIWKGVYLDSKIVSGVANQMTGTSGNDLFTVDSPSDTVLELSNNGIDTIETFLSYSLPQNIENLTLTGHLPSTLNGNDLTNILRGNSANNSLHAAKGNDSLYGGLGDDIYYIDSGYGQTVFENLDEGSDTVYFEGASYTLPQNVENLVATGNFNYPMFLTGNDLNNTLTGRTNVHNDMFKGGLGADTMISPSSGGLFYVDNPDDVIVSPGEKNSSGYAGFEDNVISSVDWILSDSLENLSLDEYSQAIFATGNSLNNILKGNLLDNTLIGLDGNDVFDGLRGIDTYIGGLGNDRYYVNSGIYNISRIPILYTPETPTDIIIELPDEGTDTVYSIFDYTLGANLENLVLSTSRRPGESWDFYAKRAEGNSLNNVLTGNNGANILIGGSGADTMIGGFGSDTYEVDSIDDVVVEAESAGVDSITSTVSYSLSLNVEDLILTGTGTINGTGNSLNNVITGNSANNVLNGGAGADTMAGGSGNDTYVVDSASDVVTENASAGTDIIQSSVTHTLGNNIEYLTLVGVANINGNGNSGDNVLVGNSGANVLSGGDGNDYLTGGDGDDTLDGGADDDQLQGSGGHDYLSGGTGSDTLIGGDGIDTMVGGGGDDGYVIRDIGDVIIENANEGWDWVESSVSYTLSQNVEELMLDYKAGAIDATGNSLNNLLTGNKYSNVLNGGLGDDTMEGGLGDDIYIVDSVSDVVFEIVNGGIDTLKSGISYSLGDNVENLSLTGSTAIDGRGNELSNYLVGNSASNTLYGDAAGITGNTAPLTSLSVFARGGIALGAAPLMEVWIDGVKAQTFEVSSTTTQEYVVSAANLPAAAAHRVDVVFTNDAYDAATGQDRNLYVDRLRFNGRDYLTNTDQLVLDYGTGTGARDGMNITLSSTGVIASNAALRFSLDGSDRLDGGAGADTLVGGTGDDIYYVDNVSDAVVELSGQGFDTVRSSVSHSLASHVDNLMLTGSAVSGTGNDLANLILGNSGNNILDGGAGTDSLRGSAGADTLIGGLGNDLVDGGAGNDTYHFSRGHGQDSIWESDTTVGNQDVLSFDSSVAYDQLWFKQVGNNLEISVIGTTDKLTVSNWYVSSQWRVEQIAASDKILVDTQVQALVNAMVSMPPPPLGQTALSAAQASALQPVLASSWQ